MMQTKKPENRIFRLDSFFVAADATDHDDADAVGCDDMSATEDDAD